MLDCLRFCAVAGFSLYPHQHGFRRVRPPVWYHSPPAALRARSCTGDGSRVTSSRSPRLVLVLLSQVIGASADGAFLIYCNGPNVIVRSIDNPHLAMVYGQHAATVKSAKFAPTGKYVASGDVAGKVRVWAFTHPEHLLKYEMPGMGGEVEDVAWDSESKRIAAVGGGSLKARVFSWDTGSSLAEIAPPMKKNLTVDFKPTRPFRLVMGGEDFYVAAYQGPPFK